VLKTGRTETTVMVAGIVALGAVLRCYQLGARPLEEDELYTLRDALDLGARAAAAGGPGIRGRPLYYLLQHLLLPLHDPTPAFLRLPPVVFALLGLWVTWKLGRRVFGPLAGGVAALLAAVAPWLLYESQFARYWTLIYLLAGLATLLLLEATATERRRPYVLALLTLVAGVTTHPTFLFPLAGIALGLTVVAPDGVMGWRWPTRTAWSTLWVPFLAALALGWIALKATGGQAALQNKESRGVSATLTLVPAIVQWLDPVLVVTALLGAVLLLVAPRASGDRRWAALALGGGSSTLLLLLAASLRTAVYADYATGMLPLVFVTAGGAVQRLSESLTHGGRAFALGATAVLVTAVLPGTASHLSDGTRFDYRPAYAYVRRAGEGILVGSPAIVARHYASDLRYRESPASVDTLSNWLAGSGTLWVIAPYHRNGLVADAPGLEGWLFVHCRPVLRTERPRFDYRVYRVDLYRCGGAGAAAS